MYTCKVFNDFSMKPSYVVDFETRGDVDTFVDRVSKNPYFSRVQVTDLSSVLQMIEEANFIGHEWQQVLDTINHARTRARKKLFETVQVGDQVMYQRDDELLSGTITEKFCDQLIIKSYVFDPLNIVHIEKEC